MVTKGRSSSANIAAGSAVPVVKPDELIAMDAVERQHQHHQEVRDQQRDVEGVPAIRVLERVVGVMRLPVVAESVRRGEEERERIESSQQRALRGVQV
jgi:hypothetical protein